MKESAYTIEEFARSAFGPAPSLQRIAARANEELAEMLRAITSDQLADKVAEEAADTAIVLFRLGANAGLDMDALWDDVHAADGATGDFDASDICGQSLYEMSRIFDAINEVGSDDVGDTITDLMLVLRLTCESRELGLSEAIDTKMAVNRTRTWKRDGTGHGYHFRDKGAAHG